MKRLIVMAVIVLALNGLTQASVVVVKYDFGTSGHETLAPSQTATHITAGDFGYSGSVSPMYWGGSEGRAYAVSGGWNEYENFFHFTISIAAGWELDVSSLQFDSMSSYAYGPKYAQVTYGANANVIETDIFIGDVGWTLGRTADNTLPTGLKGNVEFSIYAKGGSGTGGFLALDNVTLNGSVFQNPEPATICLLGLGALSLLRKKK
jgi:hypothetical protein